MTRILFDTWVSFLEKNGLRHIYMNGEDNGRAFIKKLDTIKIPAHMPTIPNQNIDHFKKRMIWQMSYTNAKINKIVAENKKFKQFLFDKGCIDKGNASKAVVDLIKDIINCDKVYERVDECH
jgi:hypothetical protein